MVKLSSDLSFSMVCLFSRGLTQQKSVGTHQAAKWQNSMLIFDLCFFKVSFTDVHQLSFDRRRLKTLSVAIFWLSEIMSYIYDYHIESIIVYYFLSSMKDTAWMEPVYQFIILSPYVLKFPLPLLSHLENNDKAACQNLRSTVENLWILVWFCPSCSAAKGMT